MAKEILKEMDFKFEIGSNIVMIDGAKKYLDIIVWKEVKFEDIKDNIVG